MATTALAALLLLAGLQVIASLGRGRVALARRDAAQPRAAAELVELLRWDLKNARFMKTSPNELALSGYGALDAAALAPSHRPVTVVYRLRPAGARNWVVREQTNLDAPTNRNRWSELVCSGVRSFELQRVARPGQRTPPAGQRRRAEEDEADDPDGWHGPEQGLARPLGYVAVPNRLRLLVLPAGPGGPAADELIYIR